MKKTMIALAMLGSIGAASAATPTINSATCGIVYGETICEVSATSGAIHRANPRVPATATWQGIGSVAALEDLMERFAPGVDVRGFVNVQVLEREIAHPTYVEGQPNPEPEVAGTVIEITVVQDARGNTTGYFYNGTTYPTADHLAIVLHNEFSR